MIFLLDTNIIVDHLRGNKAIDPAWTEPNLHTSVVCYGELLYGCHKSTSFTKATQALSQFLEYYHPTIFPITDPIIERFAAIKTEQESQGLRLDDFDLLIAATALVHNCILVTHNTTHFPSLPENQLLKPA